MGCIETNASGRNKKKCGRLIVIWDVLKLCTTREYEIYARINSNMGCIETHKGCIETRVIYPTMLF